MEFCPFSHCTKTLHFSKHRQWPAPLPAIAWNKHLLCGFDRQGQVLNFSEGLPELLKSIYPELTLTELAQLFKIGKKIIADQDQKLIIEQYGFRDSSDLCSILNLLPLTPPYFQDFVHNKKISPRELSPLRALPDLALFSELLSDISLSSLSKSQAVQMLEFLIELFLMDNNYEALSKQHTENSDSWFERISCLRFPMTKKSDQEFSLKTSSLAWPNQVRAEWVRKGDQAGVQITLFANSQADLFKKISGLNKLNQELSHSPEKLWTNS